jgi:hypothetical protein
MIDGTDDLRPHLRCLEERLFDQSVRNSRASLETLLSPNFREIGSSGRLFTFEDVIAALLSEPADGTTRALTDFEIEPLDPCLVLVTYRSERIVPNAQPVKSLRSSIWRHEADGRWRMVFPQGTPTR